MGAFVPLHQTALVSILLV
jgi:hypothetical protein